ncbi:MAG: hypothetical protein KGJ64_00285 [Betaproteobacteria bacterium]|nr:hypothetical protein [Betaproteobacteria bacterium]
MSLPASTSLFELREALRGHGPASAAELARRLQRPPAVVQAMLEHWQRRGRVRIVEPGAAPSGGCGSGACSSCGSCSSAPPAGGDARAERLPPARYAWCEQRVVGVLGVAAGTGAPAAGHRLGTPHALR